MFTSNAPAVLTSNTVRNLTNNIGTGTTTTASVIGISITSGTPNSTLTQNTISNLTNTNAAAAAVVTGIQFNGATANLVARNQIYGISAATSSAAAEINGIRIAGGTTTYRNNMIAIGAGTNNAIGTGSTTGGVNGIFEAGGTNAIVHNSVYIGGAPTAGVGPSYAFASTQTAVTRSLRDNILFNARSNAGATGKNYVVRVAGTAPNPAGCRARPLTHCPPHPGPRLPSSPQNANPILAALPAENRQVLGPSQVFPLRRDTVGL